MKVYLLLALLVGAVLAGPREEGKRLIQSNEGTKRWLTQSEVDRLVFQPAVHNFMDVTDFDALYEEALKKPAGSVRQNPIPKTPSHVTYVKSIQSLASATRITNVITTLSNYNTRYYRSDTGVASAKWIQDTFTQLSAGRPDIVVTNFTYPNFPQPSVIATIPGSGPNKDTVVIIGAHIDSVGSSATGRSPGADDDGSGTSSIIEIFNVLVQANYKPDYTLQFMGYAAEEAGLLGSQGIAVEYQKQNIQVYAVLQLDMTGYNNGNIGIINDYTSAELTTFVKVLVDTYTTLKWQDSTCGYGCSDHASWNRTSVRASFPFETAFGNHNPYIHTSQDTLSHLDPAHMLQFVNLGLGFAVELAGVA